MIEFSHPWYLLLGILIPVIAYYMYTRGKTREGSVRLSSVAILPLSMIRKGKVKINVLRIIELTVLSLIVMGLSGPRKIDKLQETTVEVVDIILAVDISSSMLADDFKPNRLEAVKETARTFIENRTQDRIGILVFAGETFIQCPLTVDKEVLMELLKDIQIAEREYDGTAIGMVIANATNRLRHSDAESKIIVLLSDGSNNAGELDPITAADLAAQFDIRIHTIGAGTNQDITHIPNRGYIKNEIDEETLISIAEKTGGQFFRATDVHALENVYAEIDNLERTEIEIKEFNLYRELYGLFLIPAMILGLVHGSLNKNWKKRIRK